MSLSNTQPTYPYPARKTQRAPLSCKECTRRKIRCDKIVPCRPCFERGDAAKCKREVVKVKGRVIGSGGVPQKHDFADVREELAWLRMRCDHLEHENSRLLETCKTSAATPSSPLFTKRDPQEGSKKCDNDGFALTLHHLALGLTESNVPASPAQTTDNPASNDVVSILARLSKEQSRFLVQYHIDHLNWVHCALHTPTLLAEHDAFRDELERGMYINDHHWNALLLAIYASSVFYMDDKLACNRLALSEDDLRTLPATYFHAAIEALNAANHLQSPHFRSLQIFCVLTLCFPVLGNLHHQYALLNAMIYISQNLNLHTLGSERVGDETKIIDAPLIKREIGRRMFWTLTIMDWVAPSWRVPALSSGTFDTAFPGNFNDEDLEEGVPLRTARPPEETTTVSYHFVMAQIACYKQSLLRGEIHERPSLAQLREAERSLDRIVSTLPNGLNDSFPHPFPDPDLVTWFRRYALGIQLRVERVYLRMSSYRGDIDHRWTKESRNICRQMCREIVESLQLPVPSLFKKYWPVSANSIYTAFFFFLDWKENRNSRDTEENESSIKVVLDFLEPLVPNNNIAARGWRVLRYLIASIENKDFTTDLDRLIDTLQKDPGNFNPPSDAMETFPMDGQEWWSSPLPSTFLDPFWLEFYNMDKQTSSYEDWNVLP